MIFQESEMVELKTIVVEDILFIRNILKGLLFIPYRCSSSSIQPILGRLRLDILLSSLHRVNCKENRVRISENKVNQLFGIVVNYRI